MDKRALIEKIKALAASTSCCPELKQTAKAYLSAFAFEQTAVKSFLAALNEALDTSKQTLIEKVRDMAMTPTCCPVLRQAATSYLGALTVEKTAAKNFLAELEKDVVSIDDSIKFLQSDEAIKTLGADLARKFADNAKHLKTSGVKHCNCPACTLGLEILADKEILLA